MNSIFTSDQIDILLSHGFRRDDSKNSGNFFIDTETKTIVIIPKGVYFKLEFFELCEDGDGDVYEDYDYAYSTIGQTLTQFIQDWI